VTAGEVLLPEPVAVPVLRQTWNHTGFVHWPCPSEALGPLVPPGLEVDRFEGQAWLSLVMFRAERSRLPGLPPVPFFSTFTEINLRTYVTAPGDRPALWFLSLEASNVPVVLGARALTWVPYYPARTSLQAEGETVRYRSRRLCRSAASLDAEVRPGRPYADHELGQLDHFLTARWGAYSVVAGRLRYNPVEHPLWPLHHAELISLDETITSVTGVPGPEDRLLVQYAPAFEATLGLHRRVRGR
jgi:uncharacterized protein YqjF (DUF2071 family)